MPTIQHIHSSEMSLLWRVRVMDEGKTRKYIPAPWGTYKHRLLEAYQSQDFSAVRFLLIKTSETRYYPIPKLLNLKEEIPYFAEEAMARLVRSMEDEFGDLFQ